MAILTIEYAVVQDGKVDHTTYTTRTVEIDDCDLENAFNDPISTFDVPEDLAGKGLQIVGAGY